MQKITVAQLFEDNREKLRLQWVAGLDGGLTQLNSGNLHDTQKGLIGHFNFIHPNWIQVIARLEIEYFDSLSSSAREDMLRRVISSGLACMIIAGDESPPLYIQEIANAMRVSVLRSQLASMDLMWLLRPYLLRALAESTIMHGVFLDVLGVGVMLTGNSGVGKSELALELISRGSGFIADDVIQLHRMGPETLEASCPPLLRDLLELRGLGILNIRTIFGEAALRPRKNLKLIVRLERPAAGKAAYVDRLPLKPGEQEIMGVAVSEVTIPVAAGRNLAVLVEAAVRNHVLKWRGIDSTSEFIARQARQIDNGDAE
jgi:HPr kinase/phosphorylase